MNPDEEIAALEDLIDQILRGLQDAIQSGEVLSDEFQGILAQELEATTQRIDQLRQQGGPGQAPPPPQAPIGTEPPPSPGAQLMWILSGSNPQAFTQYLQTYPDPELNALAQNPQELQRNIEFLSRMMPQGALGEQDGISHADINSSNIYGYRYDPKSKRLLVRFQGGSVYKYEGVPPQIYNAFDVGAVPAKTTGQNNYGRWWTGKIPSLGAAFYNLIRQGGYPYERMH